MSKIHSAKKLVIDFILVMLGNAIMALGTAGFAVPAKIILGGASGLALSFQHYVFYVHLSTLVLAINIIAFVVGYIVLGKKFAVGTLVSTFAFPFFLALFEKSYYLTHLTKDTLLAAVYAGFLIGVGLGLVLRLGYSTGGMDIPPLVIEKKLGFPVSVSLYLFDFGILILQIFISDREQVLYGILLVVLYTVILDRLLINGKRQIQLKIISPEYQQINKKIQTDLDRGTTLLSIEGGYTGRPTYAVLTVVSPRELFKLQELIRATDPNAFITINEVREVRGRGFSLQKEYH